jgi:hypothetical protein
MHTLASARYNHYYIGMGNYIVLDQFPLPMSSKMCEFPFQWDLQFNPSMRIVIECVSGLLPVQGKYTNFLAKVTKTWL